MAKSSVAGIELTTVRVNNTHAQTYLSPSLESLNDLIDTPGTGRTPESRLKYVIFVTDGLNDEADPTVPYGHRTGPLDPAICQTMKARGVKMFVLYTTYLPMPERAEWRDLVRPYTHQIAPNLESCASPNEFFEASDDANINLAMQQIFANAIGKNRITR